MSVWVPKFCKVTHCICICIKKSYLLQCTRNASFDFGLDFVEVLERLEPENTISSIRNFTRSNIWIVTTTSSRNIKDISKDGKPRRLGSEMSWLTLLHHQSRDGEVLWHFDPGNQYWGLCSDYLQRGRFVTRDHYFTAPHINVNFWSAKFFGNSFGQNHYICKIDPQHWQLRIIFMFKLWPLTVQPTGDPLRFDIQINKIKHLVVKRIKIGRKCYQA